LDGINVTNRILRLDIEGPEIDRIIRFFIQAVKGYSDKALLEGVLSSGIEFNHAVGKRDARKPRQAYASQLFEPHPLRRTVNHLMNTTVEDLSVFSVDEILEDRLVGVLLASTSAPWSRPDNQETQQQQA
jgi:hypothetical protein